MNSKDSIYVGVKFRKKMAEIGKGVGEKRFKEDTRRFLDDVYRFMYDNGRFPTLYDMYGSRVTYSATSPTFTAPTSTAPGTATLGEYAVGEVEADQEEEEEEEEPAPEEPHERDKTDPAAFHDPNDYDDLSTPWQMPTMQWAPWWPVQGRDKSFKLHNKYNDLEAVALPCSKSRKGKLSPKMISELAWGGSEVEDFGQLVHLVEFPTVLVSEEDRNDLLKDWVEVGLSLWHPEVKDFAEAVCRKEGLINE